MWREKYYFVFVVLLSFLMLLNLVHSATPVRINGNISLSNLPVSGLHFDANGLEKLVDANYTRIDNNCYFITLKIKDLVWLDLNLVGKGSMNWNTFLTKWNVGLTQQQALAEYNDMIAGYTWTASGGSQIKTKSVQAGGQIVTTNTCFKGVGKANQVKGGLRSIYIYVDNNANVSTTVTPETVYPYYNDWATGLHYYSQAVNISNDANSPITLTPDMFSGVGIGYTLMADYNVPDFNFDGNNGTRYNIVYKPFDSNLWLDANQKTNIYFNYATTQPSGKWDFHFYWKDINGNVIDYLIDPYWTFTVIKNSLNADWNKSFFVYQRSSDASWEANGELDWNLASRNDTNYTSWSGQYVNDYNLPADTNLIGTWHFNNITRNDAVINRNGNNAIYFLGNTQTNFVRTPNLSSRLTGLSQISLGGWIDDNALSHNFNAVFGAGDYPHQGTGVWLDWYNGGNAHYLSGYLQTTNALGHTAVLSSGMTANVWHHVIMTYDGSFLKIYLDGVQFGASSALTGTTSISGSYETCIGTASGVNTCSGSYNFAGGIDNFRIWNTALTATDVNRIFMDENGGATAPSTDTNRSNLIAEYLFDENATSPWATMTPETSGNALNGTVINSLGAVSPDASGNGNDANIRNGSYLSIDGTKTGLWKTNSLVNPTTSTTGYTALGSSTNFLANKWTISAWINKLNSTTGLYIITRGQTPINYYMQTATGDKIITGVCKSDGNCPSVTSVGTTPVGTWNHVVGTFDGNTIKVYINGALSGTSVTYTDLNMLNIAGGTQSVAIGSRADGGNQWFFGSIEETALWKRALSDSEVLALYQKQKSQWMDANLVGYWKFNLASGTTVFDSARGNNGTLTGSGANINAQGLWDTNALTTNGSSQYVNVPNNTSYKLNGQNNISISFWLKLNNPAPSNTYYGLIGDALNGAPSTNSGFQVYFSNRTTEGCGGTNLQLIEFDVATSGGTNYTTGYVAQAITDTRWHHITATYDGNQRPMIYIDGINKITTSGTCNNNIGTIRDTGTANLGIGAISNNQGSLNGYMDEVKIYSTTLTPAQVQADYNQWIGSKFVDSNVDSVGGNVTLGTVTVNKNLNYNFNKQLETFGDNSLAVSELKSTSSMGASALYNDANLVGLWHLNDKNAQGWVLNSATNTRDGNLLGTADVNATGLWGTNALNLPGGASSNLLKLNAGDANYTNNFTITAWVKPNATPNASEVFSIWSYVGRSGPNNRQYLLRLNDASTLAFYDSSATAYTATGSFTPGKWAQIGIIINGSSSKLFYNGIQIGTNFNPTINYSATQPIIGGAYQDTANSTYSASFNGAIEEVAIWGRALSTTEVASLYNSQAGNFQDPNLVGLWHLNDKNAQGWFLNSATNTRDANAYGGLDSNTKGLWDTNAGWFDGNKTFAKITDSNTTTRKNLSLSVWFKGNSTKTPMSFITKAGDISTNISWFFDIAAPGGACATSPGVEFYVSLDGGTTNRVYVRQCGLTLQDGQWHNLVGTFAGGSSINLYVDGVSTGTVTGTIGSVTGIFSSNFPIEIGAQADVNGLYNGIIEDVAMWNSTLTATQVQELYRKGVSRLDLNIFSCTDNTCNSKSAEVAYTDINNNTPYTANILGTWFNSSEQFVPSQYFDTNQNRTASFGSYLQDLNIFYYDVCNPTINYDWILTQNQVCTLKKIDINSGRISIAPNVSLTLIDCNVHHYDDLNTFFGINYQGIGATLNQTRGCRQAWHTDSNIRTSDCTWWQ